jgi:hypothetical protein
LESPEIVEYVENDLKEMSVIGWRKIAGDTEAWKLNHVVVLGPAWAIEPVVVEERLEEEETVIT